MLSRKILLFTTLILISVGLSGCNTQSINLNITCSTQFLELAEELARNYKEQKPETFISVKGTLGQEQLLLDKGLTDIIIADHNFTDKKFSSQKLGAEEIIVVVNKQNPLSTINNQQLSNIYTGQVLNWNQYSTNNTPIQILSREPASGIRQAFEKIYINNSNVSLRSIAVNSHTEMQSAIESLAGGIGYISKGAYNNTTKEISVIDSQTKIKLAPPKTELFLIWTNSNSNSYLRDFLEYIQSQEAQKIIKARGLSPQ